MTEYRVKTASFRSDLADIINRVRFQNSRVTVTNHGEPVATLISMNEAAEFERLRRMYTTMGNPEVAP